MSNLKRGANPRPAEVRIPRLENFVTHEMLATALPAVSGTVDRESLVSEWPMYANGPDPSAPAPVQARGGAGDCTCAGAAHAIAQWTAYSGKVPGGAQFTDDAVLGLYTAVSHYDVQTGANDNGAALYQVMDQLMDVGIKDNAGNLHKIEGYVDIASFNDLGYLKQVLNAFGTVYLGVNVSQQDEESFANGQPFTLAAAGKNVGPYGIDHCVIMSLSAFAVSGVSDDETIITWGAEQKVNVNWASTNIGEAIAIITSDWIEANGDSPIGQAVSAILTELKAIKESGTNPSKP
jgi:hypothetical protein